MASKRLERIKKLYNSVIVMDFIKSAKDDEDIEGLEEALMGGEIIEAPKKPEGPKEPESMEEALMGKPEVVKVKRPSMEPEEFVPPEELAKQLGVEEEIEKKEPVLPHRIKERGLFGETETTKLTPGAFKAKVCPVCGAFNFPVWKKECARCKGEYRRMLQDVDYEGYSPRKAIMIAALRSKGPKGKRYLGEEALREIWDKEGHIELPEEIVDIEQELTDRRGLVGVPNRLRLQAVLENKLNVVRVPTTVHDEKTGREYKTTDVYYDPEGNPVPIKYKDRDYFSLFEVAKRLQLSPSEVLKRISDYNTEQGTDPATDPNAVKPAVYIDDLNQAFSWKAIEHVFADRVKEVYEANVKSFLAKTSKRWEYLKEKATQLALTRNVRKHEKEKLLKEMGEHPQKKQMARLLTLRAEEQERRTRMAKIRDKIEEAKTEGKAPDKNLAKALKEFEEAEKKSMPERKTLEGRVGVELTSFMGRMRDIRKNYNRVVKSEKRIRESLERLKRQITDYITAFKDKVPQTLQDLAMSQTGRPYGETKGAEDIDALAKELQKQKTSSFRVDELHRMLKIADELEPLPGQLSFFPEFEKAEREREIEKELHREPTEEEMRIRELKVKNIMKRTRLTEEEAEDRLYNTNHPLADPEGLNPKQLIERKQLIKKLLQEHPTKEEAMARIEEMEAKPLDIAKRRIIEEKPEAAPTTFSERVCPHCGEKGFLEDSPICQKCTFQAPENMKQVVIEHVTFPLILDKEGNPIPKLDEAGNVMIDARGNIMYKKRQQKSYVLVQLQLDDANRPMWATARKVSALSRDVGAKTELERAQYFSSTMAKQPKIRGPKPISKRPEDFRPLFVLEQDETGELVKKPTGETEHRQKCKGCPDPWVKISPQNFDEYPPIETAVKFLKGEELPRNTRVWKFEDVFVGEEPERVKRAPGPTILPTGSSRFDKIMKLYTS